MDLLNDKVIKRFFNKINIPEENMFGCWEWTGGKIYGNFKIDGKNYRCNRISYLIWNKKFPNNLCCHTCDNPSCVNPLHLWDGNCSENIKDMYNKKRQSKNRHKFMKNENSGIKNFCSKLTEEQVLAIRNEYNNTEKKWGLYTKLAKKYNLKTHHTIRDIISHATWSHI